MRRLFIRQNIKLVIFTFIMSILILSAIDWQWKSESLVMLLEAIEAEYLKYIGWIIIGGGISLTLRYFSMIKKDPEGNIYYTLPIKREKLWKYQWISIHACIFASWCLAGILVLLLGNIRQVQLPYFIAGLLARIATTSVIISFFMWLQLKTRYGRRAAAVGGALYLMIQAFLDMITKLGFEFLGLKGSGIMADIHNAYYTFLYSNQTTKALHQYARETVLPREFDQSAVLWQVDQYWILYGAIMFVLLISMVFFYLNGKKRVNSLPKIREEMEGIYTFIIWMLAFVLAGLEVMKLVGAYAYYNLNSFVYDGMDFPMFRSCVCSQEEILAVKNASVNIPIFLAIVVISLVLTVLVICLRKGITKIYQKKRSKEEER